MELRLSDRVLSIKPSPTLAVTNRAAELKAAGKDIIGLGAGEPDFDTPEHIKAAAIKAIESGFTKYTAVDGTASLKKAIIAKFKRDNNLDYQANQILVSSGGKQSFFNLALAFLNKGDEVIIPAPYWVTYPEQVKFSDGVPVFIETDDTTEFKITPEQLKAVITPKTKVLLLNTPSNPTGSVYSREELLAIGEVLKGTDILVFSDEMYEKIMYNGKKFTAAAEVSEDMYKRTVTINGLSKAVAMTGWRFGYIATPDAALAKALTKLQGQVTSNINTMTQYAAIPALEGDADETIEMMRVEFEKRKNYAVQAFNDIKGLSCVEPDGAFYLFVNIKNVTPDSMKFCADLLEEKGVALVPGLAFGTEGYVRFSFATDLETIKEGIKRVKEFVESK